MAVLAQNDCAEPQVDHGVEEGYCGRPSFRRAPRKVGLGCSALNVLPQECPISFITTKPLVEEQHDFNAPFKSTTGCSSCVKVGSGGTTKADDFLSPSRKLSSELRSTGSPVRTLLNTSQRDPYVDPATARGARSMVNNIGAFVSI